MKTIKAGVARIDITPRIGTPLAGSCRLRPAKWLCDRLSAKALVLEQHGQRCAIVAADLCGFDERIVARLRRHCARRHGIQMLLCNASHTHSGPDSYNEFQDYTDRAALALRRRYQAGLERKLKRLIAQAVRRMRPVVLSYGEGRAGFGVNRRRKWDGLVQHMPNPKGFHVKTVSVFRFATPANKTVAVLFSYACHPTTRYIDEISADYPGPAQRLIEKRTGGIALFAQGAGGDIRPNVIKPRSRPRRFQVGTQRDVVRYGKELGQEVLRVLRKRMKQLVPQIAMKQQTVLLPFERRWTDDELRHYDVAPWLVSDKLRLALAEKIIRKLKRSGFPRGLPMELLLLHLSDDHAILATSHELCNPYVPIFQRMARGMNLTVLGYTNALRAYIPTRRIRIEGGYEGEWSFFYWGLPAPFHTSVERVLVRACKQLLR